MEYPVDSPAIAGSPFGGSLTAPVREADRPDAEPAARRRLLEALALVYRIPARGFWSIPLQAKLLVPLLLLVSGASAALAAYEIGSVDDRTRQAYEGVAQRESQVVATQYQENPADAAGLNALLKELAGSSSEVRSMALYQLQPTGPATLLAAGGSPAAAAATQDMVGLKGTLAPEGAKDWVAYEPIGGRSPAAVLVVHISGTLGAALRGDLELRLEVIAVLQILALLLGFRLWTRLVVGRRLDRLTSVAAQVADGSLEVSVKEAGQVKGGDEVSRLGGHMSRMVSTVKRRAERQAALDLLTEDSARGLGLVAIYARAGQLLAEGIGAELAAVYEIFAPSGMLILRSCVGDSEPRQQIALMGPEQFQVKVLAGDAALEGGPDVVRALRLPPEIAQVAAINIPGRHSPYGMLLVGLGPGKTFTPEQLDFMTSVSHMVAAAVSGLHDPLTGLPNRSLFEDRLSQAIREAHRTNENVCLYFIDLDNFKEVNDSLGHQAGDDLLKHVAERLRNVLRSTDLLARLGGDEFALVQTVSPSRDQLAPRSPAAKIDYEAVAVQTASRLLRALAAPFRVDSAQLYVGASIGVSIYPDHGSTPNVLNRNADRAMYEAKLEQKGAFRIFTESMHSAVVRRLTIETGLRAALRADQLQLHFQPQVSVSRPGTIVGFEALIRWPGSGTPPVSPSTFVPIAEQTGLIVPMGLWALRKACLQAAEWQRLGYPPIRMAVNVAAAQFARPDFVASVRKVLDETGLDPRLLELEVTEGSVMRNVEDVTRRLEELRALGVTIAVDDFGTGYSSLAYLHRLPFDALKVDRSFVSNISGQDRSEDRILVSTIVQLGQSLKKTVIAEGIETAEQLSQLQKLGCDFGQGYLFAQAITADKAAEMLDAADGLSELDAAGA